MGYEELFDGEVHHLAPGDWPGWVVPYVRVREMVPVEGWASTSAEGKEVGMVVVEGNEIPLHWAGEDGWSAMSIMLQELCAVLGGGCTVVQEVSRDDKWNVTRKMHIFHWKGQEVPGL